MEITHQGRAAGLWTGGMVSVETFEGDDGDLTGGALRVLGEDRRALRLTGVQPVALFALRDDRTDWESLATNLDRRARVGQQVVVPVRVGRPAVVGGDDDLPVAVRQIHERRRALCAGPGAGGGEEQQVATRQGAAIGAELLDNGSVAGGAVLHFLCHDCSSSRRE